MFDIGFSELMVIGIVALLVLGPERLPKVARTTGHLLGRLQRYVSDVKSDINREMQLEELKKLQEEARQAAMSMETNIRSQVAEVEQGVSSSLQSASSAVAGLEDSFKATAEPSQAAAPAALSDAEAAARLDQQLAAAESQSGFAAFPEPAPGTASETVAAEDAAPVVDERQLGLDFDHSATTPTRNSQS
ncbi:Sec-independent protein translocase protein TatB [Zoogloea sp.]|uniref:Sec-independent protein translocase protein TatB n=1 Tax=Zoogloea sp. TaxID=49181 RepID=UPI00141599B7|nr:MAG: twin-arginine translocase subunit TatB [Zoogloea sp.]